MLANAPCHFYRWRQVNRVRQQAGSYGFLPDPNDVFEATIHCCGQRVCVCVCAECPTYCRTGLLSPTVGAGLLANAPEQH